MSSVRRGVLKARIAERRQQVAKAYLTGRTLAEIGNQMGVAESTACRDLAVVRRSWEESAKQAFGLHRAEQLAKIDHLEATYWEAWERSLREREIKTVETGPLGTRTCLRRETTAGASNFLAGVAECIQMRCRLLGLDVVPPQSFDPDEVRRTIAAMDATIPCEPLGMEAVRP